MNNIVFLTLLSLAVLASCASKRVEPTSRNSMNNHLRTGTLAMGDVLQPYLFNDYQIAGIDIGRVDQRRAAAFDALLEELGLVRVADGFQRGAPPTFIPFRRKDNQPFSAEEGAALQQLRTQFGDSFGPVVISESRVLQGALQPQLLVRFRSDPSEEAAAAALKAYGATNQRFLVDQAAYLVDFPKHWGYKMADIGKQLLSDEQVTYVENRYFAMRRR